MSTKSNRQKKIANQECVNPEFADLFEFSSEKNEEKHEARMIMYRFLSEIERLSATKRGLKKKLATGTGKSSSFITQLFNGDKLVNLLTIAKFQKILGIKFKITAYPTDEFDYACNSSDNEMVKHIFIFKDQSKYQVNTKGIKGIDVEASSSDYTRIAKGTAYIYS